MNKTAKNIVGTFWRNIVTTIKQDRMFVEQNQRQHDHHHILLKVDSCSLRAEKNSNFDGLQHGKGLLVNEIRRCYRFQY